MFNALLCRVLDQLHESVVHVQLLVTMPQSISWIIRDKVHFHGIQRHDIHDVLHQSAQASVTDPRHFKRVPVKMKRMLVSAPISKNKTVALARLHDQRFDLRPGLVIDRPRIELRTSLGTDIPEGEFECLIRYWCFSCPCKLRIVPYGGCRILPDRRT